MGICDVLKQDSGARRTRSEVTPAPNINPSRLRASAAPSVHHMPKHSDSHDAGDGHPTVWVHEGRIVTRAGCSHVDTRERGAARVAGEVGFRYLAGLAPLRV